MKQRAVLMGTGGWAETHIRAYQSCEHVELVGLCGHANRERLLTLCRQYAIPEHSLDLAELVSRTQPDIVDIACNPHYRLEGVSAGLQPSVKLFNVEKPLALVPSEAYRIRDVCRQADKLLTVNHQKKFLPAWRKARDTIVSGELGEIRSMRATCQGNLLEQGTHLVDMALFYREYGPISWVMAQIGELEGLDKPGASAPDSAMALVCFGDGVRLAMTLGSIGHTIPGESNKWHQYAIEVYGSEGHLVVTLNRTLEIATYSTGDRRVEESSWSKHFVEAETAHLDAAALYAQDPARGHVSSLDNSMASFDTIMAMYASGCGHERVFLPRDFDDSILERLAELRTQQH